MEEGEPMTKTKKQKITKPSTTKEPVRESEAEWDAIYKAWKEGRAELPAGTTIGELLKAIKREAASEAKQTGVPVVLEFVNVRREMLLLLRATRAIVHGQVRKVLERTLREYGKVNLEEVLKLAQVVLDCIESESRWLKPPTP
jgi:hypothetical protein